MTKLLLFFGTHKRFQNDFARRYGAVFLFAVFTNLSAFSQQIDIKGKVLEENSKATVIGATVKVKGQKVGTVTNANGDFNLNVKTLPTTLVVSVVGFKSQEIDVYEAEPTTIYLAEDQNRLSAVVVVGYGTQKRSEITGSIASISSESLNRQVSSFDKALQQVSGVQSIQSSGRPGSAVTVRIRGSNSITGASEPLYVIDGFPANSDNLASISTSDIESIDILKDASATAIYGSRGANGVVIITTKKGKIGKSSVVLDSYYGVQRATRLIPLLNASQWALLKNEALINAGKSPLFTDAQITALGEGTNWQDEAYGDAPIQNHQLTVSGGDIKTRYSVSASYFDQQGILLGTDFNRYSVRANLESNVNSRLNIGLNINASAAKTSGGGSVTSLLYLPPTVPVRDANGVYTFVSPYESAISNPIATLDLATSESKKYRALGTLYGEYKILDGLKAKVLFGTDFIAKKDNDFTPSTLYEGSTSGGVASVGAAFSNTWLNENTLTYNKTIANDHTVNAVVGFTQQEFKQEGVTAGSSNFITNLTKYNDLVSGATTAPSTSSYSNWGLISYLARLNYSFREKYSFTATARADGSSRFGANHKWGYFPSGAFSWQANKEKFISPLKAISNLKFRISAGATGNQEIGQYLSLARLSTYQYYSGSGSTILTGYTSSQVANPDLAWETTYQYDGGFDLGLFNNRISIIFDAYYKKTNDLLLDISLPNTSGYTSATANYGSVRNKGIEITLNTENIKTKKFSWSSDIIFSINRNKVLSLANGADYLTFTSGGVTQPSYIKVGQPLGSFYGLKSIGIFKDAADVTASAQFGTQKAGDVKYANLNNDNVVTLAGDQQLLGNSEAKFIAGFNNTFAYSNFDLNIELQSSYGNKIYSTLRQNLELTTGFQNVLSDLTNRWTATNTSGTFQRANEGTTVYPISSRFIEDGSYLRLKTISLGYSLPKKVASKIYLTKLRAYVTANNLFTWTKYSGYDPEVNSNGQNSSQQGVDSGGYPNAKSIVAGLSVTF